MPLFVRRQIGSWCALDILCSLSFSPSVPFSQTGGGVLLKRNWVRGALLALAYCHALPSQKSLGLALEGVLRALSLYHTAMGTRKVAEIGGQAGEAEVEPRQNTKAKTKPLENVIRLLVIEVGQHLDALLSWKADDAYACGNGGYTSVHSSAEFTVIFKTSSTRYHWPPRAPNCIKLWDLDRPLGNYILNSSLRTF